MRRCCENRPVWKRLKTALAVLTVAWAFSCAPAALPADEPGPLTMQPIPGATYRFGGVPGRRIENNIRQWLVQAPKNNPGLLDMFARRDMQPTPDLVPWAGEFVGKYLISGAQAMRMSDDAELRETLAGVVDRLLALQDDDGYLGPWPRAERLRGHWDLWGHYHVMLGLMLWHEQTGDQRAAEAARRIGDLVCRTFLDGDLRVYDAGSQEMNMSILHGLALLYRTTGEDRYLQMAREVLKDFEQAGDYYRTGLEGREFFATPRPRWESLHCLQGLAEMYRATGDETFRRAFLHHWGSIRRFDMRNTGAFSSDEGASGNPYDDTAIETCCVVAWEAITIDALALTGQSTIADDLEQTVFNAVFGSQHPSGAWCTYSTPMAGQRIASHAAIAFQAREGSHDLNCCSVNGPRGYGMLSEWAVMRQGDGLAVNYYGPMTARVTTSDGEAVDVVQETDYPVGDTIRLRLGLDQPRQFDLRLRIPRWSSATEVSIGGQKLEPPQPGTYLTLRRRWQPGDEIVLRLDMAVRYESGDLRQAGRASLYRGPILLAADDRFCKLEEIKIDVEQLDRAKLIPVDDAIRAAAGEYSPWVVVDVPGADGQSPRLIDFAHAGATRRDGTPLSGYATWLPAEKMRPPVPVAWYPADGSRLGPGPIAFQRRPSSETNARYHAVLSETPTFEKIAVRADGDQSLRLSAEQVSQLKPNTPYFWKIVAENDFGRCESIPPYKSFSIDPTLPAREEADVAGESSCDIPLRGDPNPKRGKLIEAQGWKEAPGPDDRPDGAVELDGTQGRLQYALPEFFGSDYSVAGWVALSRPHGAGNGQIFSAWSRGMDDPLRLVVIDNRVSARIEAGRFFATESRPLEVGRWTHVAAVKQGEKLTLYIDGKPESTTQVPLLVFSTSRRFALGGNPLFTGPEFLACKLADFQLHGRALSAEEIAQLAAEGTRASSP